jgi:CopG family nickel-responsive transcriptional regulator
MPKPKRTPAVPGRDASSLERVSVTIEVPLLAEFDRLLEAHALGNRSEAVRDLIRRRLIEERASDDDTVGVGSLTLIYDHGRRELSDRLVEAGHAHHAHVLSTMHVHLDAHLCLEVLALQGPAGVLRRFAHGLLGLKGVLHGELVMSSTGVGDGHHTHAHAHEVPARDPRTSGRPRAVRRTR